LFALCRFGGLLDVSSGCAPLFLTGHTFFLSPVFGATVSVARIAEESREAKSLKIVYSEDGG
jgi:hypothetical protein